MPNVREYIYATLTSDAALITLGINANRVWPVNTVDNPDPSGPWIAVAFGIVDVGVTSRAPSRPQELTLWVYDVKGDYQRIDQIISRIKAMFQAVPATRLDAVNSVTQIDWEQDGEDGFDDAYQMMLRTTSFRVVGTGR